MIELANKYFSSTIDEGVFFNLTSYNNFLILRDFDAYGYFEVTSNKLVKCYFCFFLQYNKGNVFYEKRQDVFYLKFLSFNRRVSICEHYINEIESFNPLPAQTKINISIVVKESCFDNSLFKVVKIEKVSSFDESMILQSLNFLEPLQDILDNNQQTGREVQMECEIVSLLKMIYDRNCCLMGSAPNPSCLPLNIFSFGCAVRTRLILEIILNEGYQVNNFKYVIIKPSDAAGAITIKGKSLPTFNYHVALSIQFGQMNYIIDPVFLTVEPTCYSLENFKIGSWLNLFSGVGKCVCYSVESKFKDPDLVVPKELIIDDSDFFELLFLYKKSMEVECLRSVVKSQSNKFIDSLKNKDFINNAPKYEKFKFKI